MYHESVANGFAASVLFLIFLFLLVRHIRRLRLKEEQLPTVNSPVNLPPPYAMTPPPSYSEVVKKGLPPKY
ncbi:hypothetical protein KIN20_008586 [Parelaphostrongylus tenuis]|uniref:Uncharacterized protein n=1 Tax=Parelaphostrongylus tenuis TaxID=148309 RepID=A0AAD5QMS3_PARTN|nr:hypothetical protein KIN20_008586 [Parelaphostrongylus tenuis]